MKQTFRLLLCCLFLVMTFLASGCSNKPIRHLSSEACLIAQGTTMQDVLNYMGNPKYKNKTKDGEVWIFVEEHKSLLKKTPVFKWFAGSVSYDLVYITFTGEVVTNCQYRAAIQEEPGRSPLPLDPEAK